MQLCQSQKRISAKAPITSLEELAATLPPNGRTASLDKSMSKSSTRELNTTGVSRKNSATPHRKLVTDTSSPNSYCNPNKRERERCTSLLHLLFRPLEKIKIIPVVIDSLYNQQRKINNILHQMEVWRLSTSDQSLHQVSKPRTSCVRASLGLRLAVSFAAIYLGQPQANASQQLLESQAQICRMVLPIARICWVCLW